MLRATLAHSHTSDIHHHAKNVWHTGRAARYKGGWVGGFRWLLIDGLEGHRPGAVPPPVHRTAHTIVVGPHTAAAGGKVPAHLEVGKVAGLHSRKLAVEALGHRMGAVEMLRHRTQKAVVPTHGRHWYWLPCAVAEVGRR